MRRGTKIVWVAGGYAAAVLAAWAAAWSYDVRMSAMPYDTSGGMYAGGQMLFSVGVFAIVALAPTLLWLWFLRGHARLWSAVAATSLALAAVGLVAVVVTLATRMPPKHPAAIVLELLGVAQELGAPLLCAAFALFALIAPSGPSRRSLTWAAVIEALIAVVALARWWSATSS